MFRNQSLTLAQNYHRLGLVARLKGRTGGIEKVTSSHKDTPASSAKSTDSLSIARKAVAVSELPLARIERDPKTGAAHIVRTESETENPLNDPLNPITENRSQDSGHHGADNDIIKELEEQAKLEAKKQPRQQSGREEEWLSKLVAKHGEDYGAMMRDVKLNRFQQTEGDIRRRVKRWKTKQGN